jgi:sulfoxide reductase heme-binding subunit YedZ
MSHDPTFWILARAAGLTAYLLLTASMVAGLTVKSRVLGKAVRPSAVTDVHKTLAVGGLLALALHGAALVLDATVEVTPLALLVPGLVDYRSWWTGAGVLAGELMALVTASFWLRKRIGTRLWRHLHWLSYAAFLLATAHGLLAGSDANRPWAIAIYASAAGAVAAGTAWRGLRRAQSRPRPRRAPAPAPTVGA